MTRNLIIMVVAVVCLLTLFGTTTSYCCDDCNDPTQEQGQGQELIDNSTHNSSSSSEATGGAATSNNDIYNHSSASANSLGVGGTGLGVGVGGEGGEGGNARQSSKTVVKIDDNSRDETIVRRNLPIGGWGHGPMGLAESDSLIKNPLDLVTNNGTMIRLYQKVAFAEVSGSRGFLFSNNMRQALPIRNLGFVTVENLKGVILGQDPPEEVVDELAKKAAAKFPGRDFLMIRVSKCQINPQVKQNKVSLPVIVDGDNGGVGGNPGMYLSTVFEGYVARADVFILIGNGDPIRLPEPKRNRVVEEEQRLLPGIEDRVEKLKRRLEAIESEPPQPEVKETRPEKVWNPRECDCE